MSFSLDMLHILDGFLWWALWAAFHILRIRCSYLHISRFSWFHILIRKYCYYHKLKGRYVALKSSLPESIFLWNQSYVFTYSHYHRFNYSHSYMFVYLHVYIFTYLHSFNITINGYVIVFYLITFLIQHFHIQMVS